MKDNKILFINGSPNKTGNTANLASILLDGQQYETLNLVDYKVYSYGQEYDDDQFMTVVQKMKAADTIIIGSPLYWHNLCGSVRDLLDRFYGPIEQGELRGRSMFFIMQGAAPEKWMLEASEYTMKRFASVYGMKYMGMATDRNEAKKLSQSL